jgi:hypothetical protein
MIHRCSCRNFTVGWFLDMEYYTEVALVSGSADVTAMTIPSQQCKMTATIAHCVEPPSSTSSSVFELRVKSNKEIRFVNPIHFFFIETNRVFSGVFEIRFFWQRRIPETKSARDSHIQLKKAQEALPLAEFLEIFDILFLR